MSAYDDIAYTMAETVFSDHNLDQTDWDSPYETILDDVLADPRVQDAYQDFYDACLRAFQRAKMNHMGGYNNPYNPYSGKYM